MDARFILMFAAGMLVLASMTACDETDDGPDFSDPSTDTSTVLMGDGGPVIDLSCAEAVPPVAVDLNVRQVVTGTIVAITEASDDQGQVRLLEMGEEGGDVPFAIAIPERAWGNFPQGFDFYEGADVCVGGVTAEYQGTPVIFVTYPAEIVVPE